MAHFTLEQVGMKAATGYGYSTDGDLSTLVSKLKSEDKQYCVLVAMLRRVIESNELAMDFSTRLKELSRDVEKLRGHIQWTSHSQAVAVADGRLQCWRAASGDFLISELDKGGLSLRAQNVLDKYSDWNLSKITSEQLLRTMDCGPKTTQEIMQWVQKQLRPAKSDETKLGGSNADPAGAKGAKKPAKVRKQKKSGGGKKVEKLAVKIAAPPRGLCSAERLHAQLRNCGDDQVWGR